MWQISSTFAMSPRHSRQFLLATTTALAVTLHAVAQEPENWDCLATKSGWTCQPLATADNGQQDQIYAPIATELGEQLAPRNELDWIPLEALPEEIAANCPRGCEGAYVAPPRLDSDQFVNPVNAQMNAAMDQSELDGGTGIVTLSGNVLFTQGWRAVAADHVVIDRNQYEMSGNIIIREPNLLLTGESATIDAGNNELELDQAQYVLHDLRVQGGAEQIRRAADGRIYIDNATYSTCEPINETWRFVAEEIEIDPEGTRIVARNMHVKAGSVSLFYAPRISFPLGDNRKSGLLYPIFENSGTNGLDIAQPIYLNLAPNYDLTLTPRYIEERGAMIENQLRWLTPSAEGILEATFLGNDRGGTNDSRRGDDRWFARALSDWQVFDGRLSLDYNAASDRDYFGDLGTASLQSSNQTWLDQQLSYQRQGQWLDFSLSAVSYQDLTRNELRGFNELPRVELSSYWQSSSGLYLHNMQEAVAFSPLNDRARPGSVLQSDQFGNWVEGERLRLDYRAGWRLANSAAQFDMGFLLGYRQYSLDEAMLLDTDREPSLFSSGLYIDTHLFFERPSGISGSGWTQTLEPRLQYVLIEAEDQSDLPIFDTFEPHINYDTIFRHNRFGGGDRIADANQLTLGLESSLLSSSGREIVRLGLAQQFYLDAREVHTSSQLAAGLSDPGVFAFQDPRRLAAQAGEAELNKLLSKRSSLATYAEFFLPQSWYGRAMLNWSEHEQKLDYGTFELGYRATSGRSLLNIAYHYEEQSPVFRDINSDDLIQNNEIVDGTVEQLDFSAVLEFSDSWTLVGKWQQDITNRRSLEVLAGARYDACCWSTSLVWRHWLKRDDNLLLPEQALRHDNGIFVSIELKGLAGVGERLENMLSGSIPGY